MKMSSKLERESRLVNAKMSLFIRGMYSKNFCYWGRIFGCVWPFYEWAV